MLALMRNEIQELKQRQMPAPPAQNLNASNFQVHNSMRSQAALNAPSAHVDNTQRLVADTDAHSLNLTGASIEALGTVLGQAQRGENKPLRTLCTGLQVTRYIDAPFAVFQPIEYVLKINGGALLRAALTDAKLTLGVSGTTSTGGQSASDLNLVFLKHQERQYLSMIDGMCASGVVPASKEEWHPIFFSAIALMSLFATARLGFVNGGSRIIKNFDDAWKRGILDVEAIWSFRTPAIK